MRFSLLALPALALAAAVPDAAATTAAPATTEAPANTDGPATYSNTKSALSSALSEMDAKSPPPAEATSSRNPVQVSGSPASTGVAKPTSIITTTSKKAAGKPKTTTTTKAKKPKTTTTTTTKKKGKATPTPKKKNAVSKRQNIATCGDMRKPNDYAYTPSVNFANETAVLSNYYTDATFNNASKAGVSPSSAYRWVWQGFYASANAIWYQGFTTLNTYNVSACAAICDASYNCKSFNIFYERTPTLNPGPNCPKPAAYTTIKCTFWEDTIKPSHAVNYGEWRQTFPIIVAGSNGYTKGT